MKKVINYRIACISTQVLINRRVIKKLWYIHTMKHYETKQNKKRNICILTVLVPSQVYIIVKTHQIIYLN